MEIPEEEKVEIRLNVKRTAQFRNWFSVLILVSVISALVLADLFFTKPVSAGNGVVAVGEIEVYDSDGITPLTGFDLPLFAGGIAGTFTKYFFINNTGDQPVDVYWNVTASSIYWEKRAAPYQDMYERYEGGTLKYSFGITQDTATIADYWHPDGEAIALGVNERVKLRFELHYTGEPRTAETFTMTVSIYVPGYINGDVNGDHKVDGKDIAAVAQAFGSYPGHPRWNPQLDLNQDGKIDGKDITLVARNFGKTWP